jgi:hypothetical protein
MFKVRRKDTNEIVTVLSVDVDHIFSKTFFFVWENNGWRWRDSINYVPPNYKENKNVGEKEIKR